MGISGRGLTLGLSRILAGAESGKIAGEDRARALTQQAEDRQRQALHDMLSQNLLSGQIEDRNLSRSEYLSHKAETAAAATRLRANPRYQALWDLPDNELVATAARLELERARPGVRNAGDLEKQRQLRAVESQVDDTARDLTAARRQVPKRPMIGFSSPADSTAFAADSTAAAGRVKGLAQRADSLGLVRDALAAQLEGRPVPVARPSRKRRVTSDQADYLKAIGRWDPAQYEVGTP